MSRNISLCSVSRISVRHSEIGLLTSTVNVGSPNGQAVGYFLAQHKAQLGGKYVSKINIFKGDDPHMVAVCLLFTIVDRAGAARVAIGGESNGKGRVDEAVVVKRVDYKKNVVRRHIVWAKL